jgi:hypothetical protein
MSESRESRKESKVRGGTKRVRNPLILYVTIRMVVIIPSFLLPQSYIFFSLEAFFPELNHTLNMSISCHLLPIHNAWRHFHRQCTHCGFLFITLRIPNSASQFEVRTSHIHVKCARHETPGLTLHMYPSFNHSLGAKV